MSRDVEQLSRLLSIMARLRDPEHGCEWDLAQDFASIAPYTIEEAYEVADAIDRADIAELRGELGDLLLQVVFHARMAEEAGHFSFHDVAEGIADKMEARHPHIFGGQAGRMESRGESLQAAERQMERRWESLKAAERREAGAQSAMDGVALALPALMRAQKLQKRAAREGFDWPDRSGPESKVVEEIQELRTAPSDELLDEAGDLLFAAVNLVRAYGVDAETALRHGNAKFERRYRAMEELAEGQFADLALDEQEALWQKVKSAE